MNRPKLFSILNKTPAIYRSFAAILLATMFMTLIGCAGNYGYLQRSREVGRMFEYLQLPEDYVYYYSGPDAIPYAIIGIHPDYTLRTKLWKRVNLTEDTLRVWLNLGLQGSLGFPPSGHKILGPDRREIGIWYSIFGSSVVKLEEDNVVVVHPPSYYPGTNFKPMIERGAVDTPTVPTKEKKKAASPLLSERLNFAN